MSSVLEQALGWAVVVGIVLAVILGRRRGKATLSAAIAQAHAQGYAEGGQATAAAYAQQSVTVAVDASRSGHPTAIPASHDCIDPYDCAVCGAVFARIADFERRRVISSNRERALLVRGLADSPRHDGSGVHDDDDDHRAAGYYFDGSSARGVPVARVGPGRNRDGAAGGADRVDGVSGDASGQ